MSDEHYDRLDSQRQHGLFTSASGYEPVEFDIDLLRLLPDFGSTKGRYMPDSLDVRQIKRALDPALTSIYVTTRLRIMSNEGLVVRLGAKGRGAGTWQRTEKGRELARRGTLAEGS